ncbi:hypothetical protein PBRA_008174 [Plasmodiophora brassicae]|uniref:Uncharacterized protein n=1 Tax=Plasmodiophora brassicae TaxID=37360 RepID=A0A0G4J023_PLABS|nr:hypothetical protein PBRA_008174 [Plasmodiophora brassicae]
MTSCAGLCVCARPTPPPPPPPLSRTFGPHGVRCSSRLGSQPRPSPPRGASLLDRIQPDAHTHTDTHTRAPSWPGTPDSPVTCHRESSCRTRDLPHDGRRRRRRAAPADRRARTGQRRVAGAARRGTQRRTGRRRTHAGASPAGFAGRAEPDLDGDLGVRRPGAGRPVRSARRLPSPVAVLLSAPDVAHGRPQAVPLHAPDRVRGRGDAPEVPPGARQRRPPRTHPAERRPPSSPVAGRHSPYAADGPGRGAAPDTPGPVVVRRLADRLPASPAASGHAEPQRHRRGQRRPDRRLPRHPVPEPVGDVDRQHSGAGVTAGPAVAGRVDDGRRRRIAAGRVPAPARPVHACGRVRGSVGAARLDRTAGPESADAGAPCAQGLLQPAVPVGGRPGRPGLAAADAGPGRTRALPGRQLGAIAAAHAAPPVDRERQHRPVVDRLPVRQPAAAARVPEPAHDVGGDPAGLSRAPVPGPVVLRGPGRPGLAVRLPGPDAPGPVRVVPGRRPGARRPGARRVLPPPAGRPAELVRRLRHLTAGQLPAPDPSERRRHDRPRSGGRVPVVPGLDLPGHLRHGRRRPVATVASEGAAVPGHAEPGPGPGRRPAVQPGAAGPVPVADVPVGGPGPGVPRRDLRPAAVVPPVPPPGRPYLRGLPAAGHLARP